MRTVLKKLTALVTLTAITLPFVQLNTVSASVQPPVPNLKITRTPGTTGTHNVQLTWDPITNAVLDITDNPEALPETDPKYETMRKYKDYGAQGYNIQYNDVTRNTPVITISNQPDAKDLTYPISNVAPNKGSLYSFKVIPYHYHPQRMTAPDGSVYYDYPGTLVTPIAANISEALLMTDIQVEASGENDTLTVTWDNPMYNGAQAFQYFKISYQRSATSGVTETTVNAAQCTKIAANALLGHGPRLQYQIKDTTNIYSGYYNVSIEPCDALGNVIRSAGDEVDITISGKTMRLTYSPYTTTKYQAINAPVSLNLSVKETGSEQYALEWGSLTFLGQISEIAIFSNTDRNQLQGALEAYANPAAGSTKPEPVLKLINAQYATSYPISQPDITTYYGIVVTSTSGQRTSTIVSTIAAFTPGSIKITPTTPDIHVPPEGNADKTLISLYWDTFLREPYFQGDSVSELRITDDHGATRVYTYDNNVVYDLLVVDDYDLLNVTGLTPVTIGSTSLGAAVEHAKTIGGAKVPAYTYNITTYQNSSGTPRAFEKNKIYYVKLIAKKQYTTASGEIGYLSSQPAYATFYIPVSGDISSPPMIRKPPLSILKDEDGNDVITTSSIGITWLEEWSEVFDKSTKDKNDNTVLAEWQTKAAKDADGSLYYGDDTKGRNDQLVDFCSIPDLDEVRSLLGIGSEVPARALNVKNCAYETKVMTYQTFIDAVNSAGGYEKYLEQLTGETPDTSDWMRFTPEHGDDGNPYTVIEGLSANTAYAILLRAYRITPEGAVNYGYASFIAASTMPVVPPLDITPTAPVIEAVSTTDTTAVLRWRNANQIEYEGVYSDVYFTDIANQNTSGMQISYEEMMAKSTLKLENGVEYRYITIEGLLPETEYNFWGRARSQSGRHSTWSNPTYFKTKDIVVPLPPRGFGIASANDVGLINKLNGTDYTPRNKNYLIMEWNKDAKDPKKDGSGTGTAVADILSHPDIIASYIAKFNNLISNKTYYFRAKTVLTIAMGADLKTSSSYAYVVQMSLEPDFQEFSEIIVPEDQTPAEGTTYRQAESEWTKTVYYRTSTSDDDYDTDFDPDLVPLPEEDFEIVYDGPTGTLTYRFRTDQKDAQGNNDNRVDQRLITKLINQQVHDYNIDVTRYNNYTILRRVVEVPYTLLNTFEERKINFGITAGDVTLVLPPETMETALVQSMPDYGDSAKLQVILTEKPSNMPSLNVGEAYAMTPQAVSLYLQTPTQYVKMPNAGAPLQVKLRLTNRYDLMDMNVGSYVKTEQTEGWSYVASNYDKETGQMSFKSQPGMYALIARSAPATVNFDQSTASMLNVASSFAITDMNVYNGNQPANSNQLLNVMDAVAKGSKSFAINKTPEASAVSTLHKAGTNIQPGAATVSREQAIASLVRLYEIKSGRQIKPTYTLDTTPYTDTRSVQQAYQYAMLKAAEIDMLNGKTAIRPKEALTLGEMFELADVIISDNGV